MIAVLAPSLFNPRMILIIIIIGTFYFFGRARDLGVNYYSRFHFTILGCLLLTLVITATLMLQNYQFNIEIYQHNPLHIKYIYAWVFTYIFYLPLDMKSNVREFSRYSTTFEGGLCYL